MLAIVAPGYKPFPPNGWGAVESIVWDYYENLLRRNIDVKIVNRANPNDIIHEINTLSPKIVHIMYDDHIVIAPYINCKKIYYTTHYAYITHPNFQIQSHGYFNNIFLKAIQYSSLIYMNVISEKIKQIYIKYGFPSDRIQVICNGARGDLFAYTLEPMYPHKSVYVAKIENRKCQYKYQAIPNIDFVGNFHNSPFNRDHPNYLGEWNKETLYKKLTHYGNLVLLSDGEADPLVVKEALNAGLGIVISECAQANLDITLPFIDVIPDDKRNDIGYVESVINDNRERSIPLRQQIKNYAKNEFSWDVIIDKYCNLCIYKNDL